MKPHPGSHASDEAREWIVRGGVQGVGFRWFVVRNARSIGLLGSVRNLDDGTVRVYARGTRDQLNELAAHLHKGPAGASVRGVDERQAALRIFGSFDVEAGAPGPP